MNWLATLIPSLRDFYMCRRHLTRRDSALTRGSAALHVLSLKNSDKISSA